MNNALTHPRFGFPVRQAAPLAPRYGMTAALPVRTDGVTWLDRLAAWAERQPMHRRLGSYTRLR